MGQNVAKKKWNDIVVRCKQQNNLVIHTKSRKRKESGRASHSQTAPKKPRIAMARNWKPASVTEVTDIYFAKVKIEEVADEHFRTC